MSRCVRDFADQIAVNGSKFHVCGQRSQRNFLTYVTLVKRRESHLKVLERELQHVSEDITEDLGLPLDQHIFIVQWLDHLRFHLDTNRTRLLRQLLTY